MPNRTLAVQILNPNPAHILVRKQGRMYLLDPNMQRDFTVDTSFPLRVEYPICTDEGGQPDMVSVHVENTSNGDRGEVILEPSNMMSQVLWQPGALQAVHLRPGMFFKVLAPYFTSGELYAIPPGHPSRGGDVRSGATMEEAAAGIAEFAKTVREHGKAVHAAEKQAAEKAMPGFQPRSGDYAPPRKSDAKPVSPSEAA